MRLLLVLAILLAGCAQPSSDPVGEVPGDGPIHEAAAFESVSGSVSRSGTYTTVCEAVSSQGSSNPSHTPLSFVAPDNATKIHVVATWSGAHDELGFDVSSATGGTSFRSTSPAEGTLLLSEFDERGFSAMITEPPCTQPASVTTYDNVQATLVISFS